MEFQPLPTFIGRFERLKEDFEYVRKIIEMKTGILIPVLPHLTKSTNDGYNKYYTKKTRQMITARYLRDIEMFGYKF